MIDPKRQQELINQLSEICEELEWVVGLPDVDAEGTVPGLMIGKEDFVYELAECYGQEVEVYTLNQELGSSELPSSETVKAKKRESMH